MADVEVKARISVDGSGATGEVEKVNKSFGTLKQQLREAQNEVTALSAKFGATSKEAIEAAKNAAILKDKISDAKALTDAFNPDAKFKALTGTLAGAAGAVGAVTGAIGLLGGESKLAQAAMEKVQSAMALSQGLQAVGESVDAFKTLKAVIFGATAAKEADTVATNINDAAQKKSIISKVAQNVLTAVQTALTAALTAATTIFNAVMAMNPIGAIVLAITLLIAAGYALINMFKSSSDAAKKAAADNKALDKSITDASKKAEKASADFDSSAYAQLGMAKASGASAAAIRKLTLELANQELQLKRSNYETARFNYLQAQTAATASPDNKDAKATLDKAIKENNDAVKKLDEAATKRNKVIIDNQIAVEQEKTDAIKKGNENSAAASKKANDDALAAAKNAAKERVDGEKKRLGEQFANENTSYEQQRALVKANTILDAASKKELQTKINEDEKATKKKLHDDIEALEKTQSEKLRDLNADTEQKKLDLQKTRALEEIEALRKKGADVTNLLKENDKIFADAQAKLDADEAAKQLVIDNDAKQKSLDDDAKFRAEKLLGIQNQQAQDNLDFEQKRTLINLREATLLSDTALTMNQRIKIEDEAKNARKAIDIEEAKGKAEIVDAIGKTTALAADIVGKNTVVGKGLGVANALINTYQGISAGVKLGFPQAIPAVLAASVAGFKAVKNILAVKVPSASGGTMSGGGSAPTIPSIPAPLGPQASSTQLNQASLNSIGNAAAGGVNRVFVLDADINNNAERARRLNRAARLG